jgi:hypothetical protein
MHQCCVCVGEIICDKLVSSDRDWPQLTLSFGKENLPFNGTRRAIDCMCVLTLCNGDRHVNQSVKDTACIWFACGRQASNHRKKDLQYYEV